MGTIKLHDSPKNARGVSLLEMLVVLVLVSILLGAVSLNFFTSSSGTVKTAAEHLKDQITVLREQSILQGTLYSVSFTQRDYEFRVLGKENRLIKVVGDDILQSGTLPEGMHFTHLEFGNNKDSDTPGFFADASGLLPPFELAITNDSDTWWITNTHGAGLRVIQK